MSAIQVAAPGKVKSLEYAWRKQWTLAAYSTSEPHLTNSVWSRLFSIIIYYIYYAYYSVLYIQVLYIVMKDKKSVMRLKDTQMWPTYIEDICLPALNAFVLVLLQRGVIQFLLLQVWEKFEELFEFSEVRYLKMKITISPFRD